MLEYYRGLKNNAVLEYFSAGILECLNNAILRYCSVGILVLECYTAEVLHRRHSDVIDVCCLGRHAARWRQSHKEAVTQERIRQSEEGGGQS